MYNEVTASQIGSIALGFATGALFATDPRLLTFAALYSEWKLNSLKIEFVERQGGTIAFALGVTPDPGNNMSLTFTNTIMLEDSRSFNIGSVPPQRLHHVSRRGWLFTTNVSQTTNASYRETEAGLLIGTASSNWAATATYGDLLMSYDISFRMLTGSQTINVPALLSGFKSKDEDDYEPVALVTASGQRLASAARGGADPPPTLALRRDAVMPPQARIPASVVVR